MPFFPLKLIEFVTLVVLYLQIRFRNFTQVFGELLAYNFIEFHYIGRDLLADRFTRVQNHG